MSGLRRRELVTAAAAGALAAGLPGSARAAVGDQRLLTDAIGLELAGALRWRALAGRGPLAREAPLLAAHARERAQTLTASLQRRGGRAPAPPALASRVHAPQEMVRIEKRAIAFYERALGELRDTRLVFPFATAMTGHAQELVAVRLALGRPAL